jgi:galactose-1-phosphate uridylyltransferase
MKQTAVEWLEEQLNKNNEILFISDDLLEQAKEMEKEQKGYSEEEVLEQLNILMSLPSSTLDKFTDKNGNITLKWFEQFKNK